jgi:mannosyltransferase
VVLTLSPERLEVERQPARRLARALDPALVAVAAVAVSAAGSARPSLWFDEAATISASTRPLPELWAMLGNIDAVHGLYYLLMHGWLTLFPPTEFLLRLPSSLAVGLTAAGVVVLARQLSSRAVGLCAGLAFVVLPRVTWAGVEARSYALSMAAAVWLTVLCVAARRGRPMLWLGYAPALAISTLLNVYVLLIVAAHAAVVTALPGRRSGIAWWALATSFAVSAVAPFLLFAHGQLAQVGWIPPLGAHTVGELAREQYFDRSAAFAGVAAVVLAGALVFRRPSPNLPNGRSRHLVVVALVWIAVPTASLLVHSAVSAPVYHARYLCFTAPALALLLGVAVVALGRSPARMAVLLALFAAAAGPNYLLGQRGPYAKDGMDYSQVADVIGGHAAAGDCLVLDNTISWKPGPIRPLTAARPQVYAKLVDPGRGRTAAERNMLWDSHIAIWSWSDRLPGCPALWTVSQFDTTRPRHERGAALAPGPRLASAPAYQVPRGYGFVIVERWQFNFAQVTRSVRRDAIASATSPSRNPIRYDRGMTGSSPCGRSSFAPSSSGLRCGSSR